MTGKQLQTLRSDLGVNAHALADVIGVHPATLYRWEKGEGDISAEPLQRQLLDGIRDRFKTPKERFALGQKVVLALKTRGALAALGDLIRSIT